MPSFCMSDLHGEEVRFHLMLDMIQFSDNDSLYVLGDVIDRTPGGIEILRYIKKTPNIHMLLGNHEAMMLDAYKDSGNKLMLLRWINRGGSCTFHEFQHHFCAEEREEMLIYLENLPTFLVVNVNGQRFNLVHASPGPLKEDHLWGRIDIHDPLPPGITICGHTPAYHYYQDHHEGGHTVFQAPDMSFIDIDCGCGYETDVMRRLACLRLDDLKAFYV